MNAMDKVKEIAFEEVQLRRKYDEYVNKAQEDIVQLTADNALLLLEMSDLEEDVDIYKTNSTALKKKVEKLEVYKKDYNFIDSDVKELEEVKKKLKKSDKYTLRTLKDYLKIDSIEIVKNIAGVVDQDNASIMIAVRDGALKRNKSIIDLIDGVINTPETYVDRLKDKEKKKS